MLNSTNLLLLSVIFIVISDISILSWYSTPNNIRSKQVAFTSRWSLFSWARKVIPDSFFSVEIKTNINLRTGYDILAALFILALLGPICLETWLVIFFNDLQIFWKEKIKQPLHLWATLRIFYPKNNIRF